jgi:hypothetical protein
MVFQIKDRAELFKIPNFGGIPNVFFGKIINLTLEAPDSSILNQQTPFSGLPRHGK